MIPAKKRDWNRESDPAGFPCPARQVTRRASSFAGGARGMCAGPTSSHSYRYSFLRLTCGDVGDLVDQQQIEIPVPGHAPILLEVERTGGYVQTPGYSTLDLVAAATSADIAAELEAVLDLEPAVIAGHVRRFVSAAGASSVDLVARDPFTPNRHALTITAGTPIVETYQFGAGVNHRDPWKVVRCGPHRRWVRCLTQFERNTYYPRAPQ